MKRMDFKGKNVLVTGGSRGIGKELARCFAAEGANLVLVARDGERLAETQGEISREYGVEITNIVEDLVDEEAPKRIFEKVTKEVGEIYVLANNAGASRFGFFLKFEPDTDLKLIRLNIIAPELLTKMFLPQMVKRGDGGILFTSSTAAFFPGPKMAVYHATKAFVQSFAEALYREMQPSGVAITLLCPGFVNTDLLKGAKGITESPMKRLIMDPAKVARAGVNGLKKRKLCVVPGMTFKAIGMASQVLPRGARGYMAKKVIAPGL